MTPVGQAPSFLRFTPNNTTPQTSSPPQNGQESAGNLYIRDTFTPSFDSGGLPHGLLVARAAGNQGFQGRVHPSIQEPPVVTKTLPEVTAQVSKLGTQELSREEALGALSRYTEVSNTTFLDDQSAYLERRTEEGVRNSVANFSLGSSKASTVDTLYSHAMLSLDSGAAAQHTQAAAGTGPRALDNYATAFGLDAEKLRSNDDAISGPERQKLQQALVNHVSNDFDNNPAIKASQNRWDSAVGNFEAGRNSVVIAASNEGDKAEELVAGNGHRPVQVPADYEKNILENDAVTSVGATETRTVDGKNETVRSAYSSVSGGQDVYADGTVRAPDGTDIATGTSFSAPKVSATMARLHRDHPEMSSAQIENLMKNRLTATVADGGQEMSVLDQQQTLDFLSKSTY